ncbi:hypothetical protein ACWEV4_34335 [Streptomyces sp. NPDC003860]
MATLAGRPRLAATMTDELLRAFRDFASAAPVTCPGAPDLVASAASRVPLAVASNCPQETAPHFPAIPFSAILVDGEIPADSSS